MNINEYLRINDKDEKPLETLLESGGFSAIFRSIGCIGDSLSSGELEAVQEDGKTAYYDYFEYSWGQFIARANGALVHNFSRGGMTAQEYCDSFAESKGFWNPDLAAQAYIFALGVNDVTRAHNAAPDKPVYLGNPETDIDLNDWRQDAYDLHRELLYRLAEIFEYTYVIDLREHAPIYDADFRSKFFLSGHLNTMGYLLTARFVMTYIDYIIRHNMDDFMQAGFIGKGVHNVKYKW